jgi:DNA-binding transcriptional LysR family regulator
MRGRRRKDKDGKIRLPVLADFNAIETFVAIMETHSISKAAQRLNTVPSAVSQRLANLEAAAQAKLFNRTTRIVSPTEAGQRLYLHCIEIIRRIETAEHELWGAKAVLSGELRIAAPVYFGMTSIAPVLPIFIRRYPDLNVSLQLSAHAANLISEGLDLAIRFQPKVDTRNGDRLIFRNERVFCASPAYLEERGVPQIPADLQNCDCICTLAPGPFSHWSFREKDTSQTISVYPVMQTDNPTVMAEAVRQGVGVAQLGKRTIERHLASGEIVTILDDYRPDPNYLIATTPDTQYMPQKAVAFVDFLLEHFPPSNEQA